MPVLGLSEGLLYGSIDTTIALDHSLTTGLEVTDKTSTTLKLGYRLEDWSFESEGKLTLSPPIDYLRLSARGYIGDFYSSSTLTFDPVGEEWTGSQYRTQASHLYDLWWTRFANWIEIENVDSSSTWYVRVSTDQITWTTVSTVFPATTHDSGKIPVNLLIQYVEVVPTAGQLTSSYALPEKLTVSHSEVVFQSWLDFTLQDGTSLSGGIVVPGVGDPYVSLSLYGPWGEAVDFGAFARLSAPRPDCSFCFEYATISLGFAFGCIEHVETSLTFSDDGFEQASLSVPELDLGLPGLQLGGQLVFTTRGKTLWLYPFLRLGSTACVTPYARIITGASELEIDGIEIYGLSLSWEKDGISFSSKSYFNSRKVPLLVSWDCWESISVGITTAACCGDEMSFKVTAGFEKGSGTLFELAETDFELAVPISEAIEVELKIGFEVTGQTFLSARCVVKW